MADAIIAQITPEEKACILNVRSWEYQPFVAPGWLDLRVGFFLSLTKATADDDQTGLAETIGDGVHLLGSTDRYWLGIGGTSGAPGGGAVIIAYTNVSGRMQAFGDTELLSSDEGLGTTNTDFWRPRNTRHATSVAIFEGDHSRAALSQNVQQHFPQIPANAGGYAVMFGMQLLRDNPSSRTIRVNIPSQPNSSDMFYSDTPTLAVLQAQLEVWPPSQQMGPVQLGAVPTAFYWYWPFRQSRLRIHAYGILKAK